MGTKQQQAKTVAVLIMAAFFAGTLTAGNLNPSLPPSAGGTMKTLDQVEPRIPICQADMPLTISTSGSYYLTENITTTGFGITVSADNVTIDLCGFTLAGPDTGTTYGISMNNRENVEIRNGTVRDFSYGIYEMSSTGNNHRIINVRVLSNRVSGILIYGQKCQVRDCTVADNGAAASSTVSGIYVANGGTVTGNTVSDNGYQATGTVYGIYTGFGSTIKDNTVHENGIEKTGDYVYSIRANSGSTIVNNTAYLNGKSSVNATVYGLYASNGCTVAGNTAGDNGYLATGSVYGLYIAGSSLVHHNTAYGNNGTNMYAHSSCTVESNHAPSS